MKRMLQYEIDCGKTTCTCKETNVVCKYRLVSRFGTKFHCQKFLNEFGDDELIDDKGERSGVGFLKRMPGCLASEIKEEQAKHTLCLYCKNRGFFSDELSGGECYCDCFMGEHLKKIEQKV
jgi:hypothetical protein